MLNCEAGFLGFHSRFAINCMTFGNLSVTNRIYLHITESTYFHLGSTFDLFDNLVVYNNITHRILIRSEQGPKHLG